MGMDRAQGIYDFNRLLYRADTPMDDRDLLAAIQQWWETSGKLRDLYIQAAKAEEQIQARTVHELIGLLHELEDRIAYTRAVTPEGRRHKARMALVGSMSREDIQNELEDALDDRSSTGHFIGLSLILDLLNDQVQLEPILAAAELPISHPREIADLIPAAAGHGTLVQPHQGEAPARRLMRELLEHRAKKWTRFFALDDAAEKSHRAKKWTRFFAPDDAAHRDESLGGFGSDKASDAVGL